jgi:DNA-binding protein WhiA
MSFSSEIKSELNELKNEKNEKKDFLRRVFLLDGYIANPEKEYHLEILTDQKEIASIICELLAEFGINAKIIEKKYKFATYVKEAESIALFLNIIGAHKALFKFEDAKVVHEMNNQINRVVNCETANLSKIVNTAVRQVEAIKKIDSKMGLKNLSENLREIAELRLKNPEMSLADLGKLLKEPIGKSGVNHRLKKLEEIAEGL